MFKAIDLVGTSFGCWKIKRLAENRVLNCGTNRTFLFIECLNCGHEFEKPTREIRRKRVFPKNCAKCPQPENKKKSYFPSSIHGFKI